MNGVLANSDGILVIKGGHFRVSNAQRGIALSPIEVPGLELAAMDTLQSRQLTYSVMLPDGIRMVVLS